MMLAELIAVLSEIADDRSQPLGGLKASGV